MILKQLTAYNLMVLMIDSADHITGKASLTLTITASKAGAAFASITPTVTERGSGWYNLALTAAHTDTLGDLALHVTSTGADPLDISGQVTANGLDDLATPADVTISVAVSATTAAAVSSGSMAIQTYYTFDQAVTSTTTSNLSTATKLWLAIKDRAGDTDANSLIFVEATAGLTVVNKATYATIANGTLVVTGSSGAWTITAHIEEAVTALLPSGRFVAELKALVSGNTVAVWSGNCVITDGVVMAYA